MSRYLYVFALLSYVPVSAFAVEPSIVGNINASGNITVNQPDALNPLVAKVHTKAGQSAATDNIETVGTTQATTRSGYRVQVFDDNNPRTARASAEACHSKVAAAFPELRAYVTFNSPYWRVKVGDFRTRAQAEAAMAELRHAFPSMSAYMRIVRDKINTFD